MADQQDSGARRPEPYVLSSSGETSRHSRATSTVAQSFAADLDSMFGLSGNVDVLSQTVEEKFVSSLVKKH